MVKRLLAMQIMGVRFPSLAPEDNCHPTGWFFCSLFTSDKISSIINSKVESSDRMKRYIFLFTMLLFVVFLEACQEVNRVFVSEELTEMAISEYGFSEVYFIKTVDVNTANELTGNPFQNACIIAGKLGGFDRLLFVPRKTTDAVELLAFPFSFELSDIMSSLSNLKDSENQKLYSLPLDDYGGLSIGVDQAERIQSEHLEWVLDTPIMFFFTTPSQIFIIVSANQEIQIVIEQLGSID